MAAIRGTHQADVITPDTVSSGVQGGLPTFGADDIQAGNGDDTVRDLNRGADGIDEGTDTLHEVERLRFLGKTEVAIVLASTSANGEQGNDQSFSPSLPADETKLAFASAARNLVAGDTPGTIDIFLKDVTTGESTRIAPVGEVNGGGTNEQIVALSAGGTKLAFFSTSSELMPGCMNWWGGIFVADVNRGGEAVFAIGPDGTLTPHGTTEYIWR